MSKGIQKIERIQELMKELKQEILSLKKEQQTASKARSLLDREAQDLEHIIENYNLSGSESARLVSRFHTLRTERREAKIVDAFIVSNVKNLASVLPILDTAMKSWKTITGKDTYQMKTEMGQQLLETVVKNYETRSSFTMTPPTKSADSKGTLTKKNVKPVAEQKTTVAPKVIPSTLVGTTNVAKNGHLSVTPTDESVKGDLTILDSKNVFHLEFLPTNDWTLMNKSIQGKQLHSFSFSELIKIAFKHGIKPKNIFTSSSAKELFLNKLLETKKLETIDNTWINELETFIQDKIPNAPQQYSLYFSTKKFALSDYNDANRNIVTTGNLKELIKVINGLKIKKKFNSNKSTITILKQKLESKNLSSQEKEGIQYILSNLAS